MLHTKFSHSGGEENTVFEIICNTLLSNSIPDSAKENIIDGILNVLPPSEELTEYGKQSIGYFQIVREIQIIFLVI